MITTKYKVDVTKQLDEYIATFIIFKDAKNPVDLLQDFISRMTFWGDIQDDLGNFIFYMMDGKKFKSKKYRSEILHKMFYILMTMTGIKIPFEEFRLAVENYINSPHFKLPENLNYNTVMAIGELSKFYGTEIFN